MNMQQADFPEAMTVETIQRLEEASARILHALREHARQQQAQQAGAMEYDSWPAAMEYDSWCARFR
jgi:hypothetical protein